MFEVQWDKYLLCRVDEWAWDRRFPDLADALAYAASEAASHGIMHRVVQVADGGVIATFDTQGQRMPIPESEVE